MKLVYFNGRGLAETSRLILAWNDVTYEDYRYSLTVNDWKTHDMTKDEFDADKASGKLAASLHKVPFLEVDDHVICQSKAIERYLATRYQMMGSNDIESAQIDSICEVVRDIKDMYQKVRRLPEDEKEQGLTTWFTETMPQKFVDLEYILSVEGYAVKQKTSLADIVLYSLVTQFFDDHTRALDATNNTPKLRAIIDRVGNNDRIKKWLVERPQTVF